MVPRVLTLFLLNTKSIFYQIYKVTLLFNSRLPGSHQFVISVNFQFSTSSLTICKNYGTFVFTHWNYCHFFDDYAMTTSTADSTSVASNDVVPEGGVTTVATINNPTPDVPVTSAWKICLRFGTFDTVVSGPIPSLVRHSSRSQ